MTVTAKFDSWKEIEQLYKKLEQLHAILAQTREALTIACTTRDALAQACNQLEKDREYNAELIEERDVRSEQIRIDMAKQVVQLSVELGQARADLAQAQEQLTATVQKCAYCNYEATGADAFKMVAEHIKSCPKHPLVSMLTKLTQADVERRECQQQLREMAKSREFWSEQCHEAEAERDDVKAELAQIHENYEYSARIMRENSTKLVEALSLARAESKKYQRQWAAMEAGHDFWRKRSRALERLRDSTAPLLGQQAELKKCQRQLTHTQNQLAAAQEATEWLWGFYDGNTLRAISGFEDDIRDAWDKLLMATFVHRADGGDT